VKTSLSWSSGKDSAWALHVLQQQHPGSVAGLLTTINEAVQRVAMHAVRRYREQLLANTGLSPLFPLWQLPTPQLAAAMIAGGLRARVACVDARILDSTLAGREFDASLLAALPTSVDPCGENGEFHTCVYDGPMFTGAIPIETGEMVTREPFAWRDFVRAPAGAGA